MFFDQPSRRTAKSVFVRPFVLTGSAWALACALGATSVVPITDRELYLRSNLIVGLVLHDDHDDMVEPGRRGACTAPTRGDEEHRRAEPFGPGGAQHER